MLTGVITGLCIAGAFAAVLWDELGTWRAHNKMLIASILMLAAMYLIVGGK